jgi:hypothetical protein
LPNPIAVKDASLAWEVSQVTDLKNNSPVGNWKSKTIARLSSLNWQSKIT